MAVSGANEKGVGWGIRLSAALARSANEGVWLFCRDRLECRVGCRLLAATTEECQMQCKGLSFGANQIRGCDNGTSQGQ